MKHILATLAFYANNPGWHSFDIKNRSTVKAVSALQRRGFLVVNTNNRQAKFTGKVFS